MSVRAYAPASIGNFAAGFDILGAAVQAIDGDTLLGDIVEIEPSEHAEFHAVGPWAHRLPVDPADNLVVRARNRFEHLARAAGTPLRTCRITLHKRLPLNSGLGSSAASIVAAWVALEAFSGLRCATSERVHETGALEGTFSGAVHLDNTAPSLLGGLRLLPWGGLPAALPFPADLRWCVVHPDLELSTARARAALPTEFPRAEVVGFAQNLATFVHACHTGDLDLLRATLRDPLAEPHRAPLVPGFREAMSAAREAGSLGGSLSGSGPSVFAVASADRAGAVVDALQRGFHSVGIGARGWICRPDPGARVLS